MPADISDIYNTIESPSHIKLSVAAASINGAGVIVISIVSLAAHCPGSGVNTVVNVPAELLSIGFGDHVPV